MLAGCGGVTEIHSIASDERGLKELGRVYRDFATKKKRGPKNLKELGITEPFAVSFFPGWPKAASPPGGIYDDDGVFQTLSWSLIVRARWIARARFAR
jgi:hypothetical protein